MNGKRWLSALLLGSAFDVMADDSPAPYWADSWRGWHFYETPVIVLPTARVTQEAPPPALGDTPELLAFAHLQRTLEAYKNIAIMRPTETNVRRYMTLEAQVATRASVFADMAQRIAWATPALDPTVQGRPVNAQALEVFDRLQRDERVQQVAQLRGTHVLLYFFRSDCPYCQAFTPTLLALQQRTGLRIEGVSLDGAGLPGLTRVRADNGIARTLNVTQVPAVFLAQPFSGQITAVGFGVLSESQLLERLTRAAVPTQWARAPLPGGSS